MKKHWPLLTNLLVVLVFAVSCKTNTQGLKNFANEGDDPVIGYELLLDGEQGNFTEAQERVITNATSLAEVMTIINASRKPALEIPEVNFSTHYVGLIALGQRNTGGHAIKIADMRNVANEMVVYLEQPKPSKYATMVITTPFVLFKFEKQAGVPSFVVKNAN